MTTAQKQRIESLRGKGESYTAIAETLGISENTIKSYCRRNKLGTKDSSAVGDTCDNCKKPLEHIAGKKKKRFCSDKCRMAWWNAHPEAVKRKAVYTFVCPTCDTEFESYGNANRVYCSRACFGTAKRVSI